MSWIKIMDFIPTMIPTAQCVKKSAIRTQNAEQSNVVVTKITRLVLGGNSTNAQIRIVKISLRIHQNNTTMDILVTKYQTVLGFRQRITLIYYNVWMVPFVTLGQILQDGVAAKNTEVVPNAPKIYH